MHHLSRVLRTTTLLATLTLALTTAVERSVQADEAPKAEAPPDDTAALGVVLSKVAHHAERFEEMVRRGCFTMSGRVEELDRGGHVDETKEWLVKVTSTPNDRQTEILKYTENSADKTADARKKAEERRVKAKAKAEKPAPKFHLPFLPSEQHRYVFGLAERDPATPTHVRVTFRPLVPAEDAFKGSAWIDEAAGEVLTLGFSPSKNPMFVDQVDVTMRFDLRTPLGRAPSSIAFDARGGFFVIVHKHYRGSAVITDAHLGY